MSKLPKRTAISVMITICMAVFIMFTNVRGQAPALSPPASLDHVVIPLEDAPPYGLVSSGLSWPMLSNDALRVQRQILIDARAGRVILEQSVYGIPIGVPLVIGLDDYLRLRASSNLQSNWKSFNQTRLKQMGDSDSGSLFEIQIPVKFPKAIRSIIGEGGPGLKVTGMRRISFAGRSEWTEAVSYTHLTLPTNSVFGRARLVLPAWISWTISSSSPV